MNDDLHDKLAAAWQTNAFEPKIRHIRFPNFKNIDPSLKIEFSHPVTALVGANGTNKTSILRALQGCPANQNLGRYWFGTALDTIPDEERNQFVYGRWSDSANQIVEMTKLRIRFRNKATGEIDPDYFEPQRPTKLAGMAPMPKIDGPLPNDRTTDRWKLIEKNVIYFDFRSEVSAFDKCLFHNDYRVRPKDKGTDAVDVLKRKKTLIRDNSKKLKSIFDRSLNTYKPGGKEWVLISPYKVNTSALKNISYILGREYTEIEIVRHRAFGVEGDTVKLKTNLHNYSEAWAGSGEFAVVQLVTAVDSAPKKSLIILDEPEVSLHPGAQNRLLQFLSESALKKQHQIVFATHSPALIESLPDCSIKVLELNDTTGKVELRHQSSKPTEAFVALGHTFEKKTIIVEDRLAKSIVETAIKKKHGQYLDIVSIKYFPGGSADLRSRDIPAWARHETENVLLLLDGDERFDILDPGTIPSADLEKRVEEIVGPRGVKNIGRNSNSDPTSEYLQLLSWANRFVKFLPGGQPESLLRSWESESDGGECKDVNLDTNSKPFWEQRASDEFSQGVGDLTSADLIFTEQLRALNRINPPSRDIDFIATIIEEFLK